MPTDDNNHHLYNFIARQRQLIGRPDSKLPPLRDNSATEDEDSFENTVSNAVLRPV